MLSKLLRDLFVTAAVLLAVCLGGGALRTGAAEPLPVMQIEQVRAVMPRIWVYVQGEDGEIWEAYLDGAPLTSRGTQPLDASGTSYLVLLDVSGSIRAGHFAAAKEQIADLARELGPQDSLTLITFGDEVKMETADQRDPEEVIRILDGLRAEDQQTVLYEAFAQCLAYGESISREQRQILLVVSDGIQDTGSTGITRQEIETRLAQASLPVYAFCADTADLRSQEELGSFARATGGGILPFGPENAARVWQSWRDGLDQTTCLCFESAANYADGGLHTLLLKSPDRQQTRLIRITGWTPDETPPRVSQLRCAPEENALLLTFSEPVLGAEDPAAYRLSRGERSWEIQRAAAEDPCTYRLLLPEDLPPGRYTLTVSGVRDDSMEANPLEESALTFRKDAGLREWLLGAGVLLGAGGAWLLLRKKRRPCEAAAPAPQTVEYRVQHILTAPETVASPADGPQARMQLELVSGPQAGRQIECSVCRSMIWGRSPEMCDLSFADPRVSAQHCVFEVRPEGLVVSDLNARNGTYVNGIRIRQVHPIHPGDRLQLGNTVLRVLQIQR